MAEHVADDEYVRYQSLHRDATSAGNEPDEDLRTSPLLTLSVKRTIDGITTHKGSSRKVIFPHYGVLGFHDGHDESIDSHEPILLNVNAPNSAFICGSQGSGKSYTLSCMMENCLVANVDIGTVTNPVAGVAFHYDPDSTVNVAEVAYLCSTGLRVQVLVSKSNEYNVRRAYRQLPKADQFLTVKPLTLQVSDLSVDRMCRLMAFGEKDNAVPLYMSVVLRILRGMARDTGGRKFDYLAFKKALRNADLSKDQLAPLKLRLDLLESFLDLTPYSAPARPRSVFEVEPGTLTIVDLSDPFMDSHTACILFDVCFGLFKERRPSCGLAVALDEAHKFMTTTPAASKFAENLLRTVREQRHNATRVFISTQEPTVSPQLLDLSSIVIVHRFASPAWYRAIREHLGAASQLQMDRSAQDSMFDRIMSLSVGQSLVFAPTALLYSKNTAMANKIGNAVVVMRTRARLGADGGTSVLASLHNDRTVRSQIAHDQPARSGKSLSNEITSTYSSLAESSGIKPSSSDTGPTPMRASSRLVLVCCSCARMVLISFTERCLPPLIEFDQKGVSNALAYATCVQCQLAGVGGSHNLMRQFDDAQRRKLLNQEIIVDAISRHRVITGLRVLFDVDFDVLTRHCRLAYLFLRNVHRAIGDEAQVQEVCFGQTLRDTTSVVLSTHLDGSFFKRSLRPASSK